MDGMEIIGRLEELGISVQLAIDCEGESSPEAEVLLDQLADEREGGLDCLVGSRFTQLPDDVAIPAEWTMNASMKRYILDASSDILSSLGKGHSPLFVLLYAAKGLCFIRGGRGLYERIEAATAESFGFDVNEYAEGWKRYAALLETPQNETLTLLPEYLTVTARLRELGAGV